MRETAALLILLALVAMALLTIGHSKKDLDN